MLANPENKFIESDLSKVCDTIPTPGMAVSTYFKAGFQELFLKS